MSTSAQPSASSVVASKGKTGGGKASAPEPIFYDVSELFHVSRASFRYYGIARTVMEIGAELKRADPAVRFVVYAPATRRFHEVDVRVTTGDAPLDIGLPPAARPIKLRHYAPERRALSRLAHRPFALAVRAANRWRWRAVTGRAAPIVNLNGRLLLSLARPKLMAEFLLATERGGERPRFRPVLYDMIPVRDANGGNVPDLPRFARKFLHDNAYAIERAERVATISAFTRDETSRAAERGLLPRPPAMVPIPLAHELRSGDGSPDLPPDLPERFVLGVGTAPGRKNLEGVLRALAILRERGRSVPHLVLAGAVRSRTRELLEGDEAASIRDRVVLIENPDQSSLVELYQRASALVIASFVEGWGLPLGEALWCGTPGLAADIPALNEVGGDLAHYFDPNDAAALAALIDRFANDPRALAAERERLANARERLRSWADVAADMAAFARATS